MIIPVECNKNMCDANMGNNHCMWKIDDEMRELYEDEDYRKGMCSVLVAMLKKERCV